MERALRVVALTLLGCIAAGCGKAPAAEYVGVWKGSVTVLPNMVQSQAAEISKAMMSNISLDLREDMTYSMSMGVDYEGTWRLASDTVFLTAVKWGGQTVGGLRDIGRGMEMHGPVMVFKRTPDKTRLMWTGAGFGTITLTKE